MDCTIAQHYSHFSVSDLILYICVFSFDPPVKLTRQAGLVIWYRRNLYNINQFQLDRFLNMYFCQTKKALNYNSNSFRVPSLPYGWGLTDTAAVVMQKPPPSHLPYSLPNTPPARGLFLYRL